MREAARPIVMFYGLGGGVNQRMHLDKHAETVISKAHNLQTGRLTQRINDFVFVHAFTISLYVFLILKRATVLG